MYIATHITHGLPQTANRSCKCRKCPKCPKCCKVQKVQKVSIRSCEWGGRLANFQARIGVGWKKMQPFCNFCGGCGEKRERFFAADDVMVLAI